MRKKSSAAEVKKITCPGVPGQVFLGFCRVGHGASWKRSLSQLLELVVDELDLGSDNDLDRGLAGTDNAGSAGGLDLLLVHLITVLDFQSQTGDAVVDGDDVLLAAQAFQNDLSHAGVVIVSQLDLQLALLVVFTAGGLQIELLDGEQEHEVEHCESSDAHGDDEPVVVSSGQSSTEQQVHCTGGEAEASTEAQSDGDGGEDAVQQGVNNVQAM